MVNGSNGAENGVIFWRRDLEILGTEDLPLGLGAQFLLCDAELGSDGLNMVFFARAWQSLSKPDPGPGQVLIFIPPFPVLLGKFSDRGWDRARAWQPPYWSPASS